MQSLLVELCTGELAQAPCSAVITGHRRRGRKAEPRATCVEPRMGNQPDLYKKAIGKCCSALAWEERVWLEFRVAQV